MFKLVLNIIKKVKYNIVLFIQTIDSKDFISIFISSITIVAFLLAIDFFSARSYLNIREGLPTHGGYNLDTVINLYQKYGIQMPSAFQNDKNISHFFNNEYDSLSGNSTDILSLSDLDLIAAISSGRKFDSEELKVFRIDKLEKRIDNYNYVKHIYRRYDSFGSYPDEKSIEYLRDILGERDYYIFLAFLIYSREVSNHMFINNDGDLNLKNVKVSIPSPFSKVSESRKNNILYFSVDTQILHEAIHNDDELIIRIPYLQAHQGLSLNIKTRENEINETEIYYSFESENVISTSKMREYFIIFFILVLIIKIAFRSREFRHSGNLLPKA